MAIKYGSSSALQRQVHGNHDGYYCARGTLVERLYYTDGIAVESRLFLCVINLCPGTHQVEAGAERDTLPQHEAESETQRVVPLPVRSTAAAATSRSVTGPAKRTIPLRLPVLRLGRKSYFLRLGRKSNRISLPENCADT
eukprot:273996-Rhodomonas_salina.2